MKKISWMIPKSKRSFRASWRISPEPQKEKKEIKVNHKIDKKKPIQNKLPYCSSRT